VCLATNKIGEPPMCMNPMGMRWAMDAMQGKPKPTNDSPGMIYMLCGATQRSNTDPADKRSPAIPIGPHWMITWPFDAKENGLPTTVRDKGAWVMFAGHSICLSACLRHSMGWQRIPRRGQSRMEHTLPSAVDNEALAGCPYPKTFPSEATSHNERIGDLH
jgi:hypothetical protein